MGKAKLAWSILFLGGDVYTLVRWIKPDGATVNLELGAPEYAAALTLFTGGLIGVNWTWIVTRYRAPRDRLESFVGLVEKVYDDLRLVDRTDWNNVDWGAFDRNLQQLQRGVEGLGLVPPPKPKTPMAHALLKEWLLEFLAIARNRDLRTARQLSSLGLKRYKEKRRPLGEE